MTAEDPTDQDRHLRLITLEPAGRGGNRLVVVTDLEGDDGLDRQRQPLFGVTILLDLRLLHRQGQPASLLEDRGHEGAVPGDNLEWKRVHSSLLTSADQKCLVRRGHTVTEHAGPLLAGESWILGHPPGLFDVAATGT